ncbi:MAG: cytochrome c oxidase subunit II [Altererythrobacter sp.]|nr:cytochrome c oxidase subunit II [Altererythrobacter sp.]
MAQATAPAAAPAAATASAPDGEPATAPAAAKAAEASAPATPAATGSYVPMKPAPGIGMPVDGGLDVQKQFSPTGRYAFKFHYAMLWVMGIISVFVLGLLIYVMWRFRAKANPVPSRNTHNTLLEVAWTIVPVLVLVAIAIPSISLLSQQYRSPPKDAITIKVTGNQWYWSYSFPDNGDFTFDSYMLNIPGEPKVNPLQRDVGTRPYDGPSHLEVDSRLVVPVGVPLRIQVTAGDVIHSFAVPALWFKIDAVPGRLNERVLTIDRPGVYYGQCSELCGVKHGYMPIAIEAVPMARWRAWVRAQGGTFADEAAPAADDATPAAAPAAPASAPPAAATPAAGGTVAPASPAPAA